jgi:hypothetical protein
MNVKKISITLAFVAAIFGFLPSATFAFNVFTITYTAPNFFATGASIPAPICIFGNASSWGLSTDVLTHYNSNTYTTGTSFQINGNILNPLNDTVTLVGFPYNGTSCSAADYQALFDAQQGDSVQFVSVGGVLISQSPFFNNFVPPVPHIESLTYATSTATARVTGYWEATTTPYITQQLSFWQYSTSLGKEALQTVTATTTGNFDFSFFFVDPYPWTSGESSTTPLFSSFTLNASLDQYDGNFYDPFGQQGLDTTKYITNIDATSTPIITASQYNASDFTTTPRDLALYPEYPCGLTAIMGCIKNAFIWTFYPTQDALDSWGTLQNTLQTKAPFGYFYSVKDAVSGLSATSTPTFSLVIPHHLKVYIFDPFDIGIGAILWFFFIFHFYKRLKDITI